MVHCCVLGCKSRSERKDENITFHSFQKDVNIRKLWIEATGRDNWEPTKYTRMCSRHFEPHCFRKTQSLTYLNEHSTPTLHINCSPSCKDGSQVEENMFVAGTSSLMEAGHSKDEPAKSSSETWTPRKKRLLTQLQRKTHIAEARKKKIAALRSKSRRLQKKNAKLSAVINTLQSKHLINQETADLLMSDTDNDNNFLNPSKSKFSPKVRKFALNLHFISPRAYNFVRKSFNTCLLHTRTLARWYESVDAEPGFSTESLRAVKLLAGNTSKKIICGLCFDEMALRKSVQWNGKNYVGFVNCGNQMNNDVLPIAKEVLVFMLTCLNGSWKLPVGYFLTAGLTAEQKASLLKTCIDLVSDCGVDVVSVTFDGCPTNFSMAKLLGCNLEENEKNPVFRHKDKTLVIFPDPCHMFKLVRNTLGDKLLLTDSEDKTVNWNFLKLLVNLQEDEGFHLANKAKRSHINFHKQIMKVRLAGQLLSESVANAIEFCSENLALEQFKNSEATVTFIRKFNTIFDIMNSRNLKAYGFKKPINLKNYDEIERALNDICDYIKMLKIDNTNILKTKRKTGFLGFIICAKSLIFLFKEIVKNGPLDFLSCYKLSQDHLEIFFSAVRSKGGFNNNPTATQFKSAFKRLLIHGELKHLTTGNCIPLSDINILTCTRPEIAINNTTDRNRLIEDNCDLQRSLESEIVVSKDHDYLADPTRLTEFAQAIIIYIAGFVVKSLSEQIKCEYCVSCITSLEKMENTLQFKKDKGGLHYPSTSVVKLCEIAEEVFKKNKLVSKKNIMEHLLQACIKKCIGLNLFSENRHFCDNHHYTLLIKAICSKYLNVRLHYCTKTLNNDENIRNFYTKLILFKGQ